MRLVWPDYLIHLKWWPGAKTHATLFTKQAREGRWLVDTQSDNRTCHESQFDSPGTSAGVALLALSVFHLAL